MSKVEYEYEIIGAPSVESAQAYQIKYRSREITKMVARRVEVSRRKLYVSDADKNGTLWRFVDTDEMLSQQDALQLNIQLNTYLKERRIEGHIHKTTVGLPVSKWHKDGRKS